MLHVGEVRKDGAKMAKSTGNLTLVADLLETAPAAAIRLMLLDRRWFEPWDYRPELLDGAAGKLHALYAAGRPAGSRRRPPQQAVARRAARRPRRAARPRGRRPRPAARPAAC